MSIKILTYACLGTLIRVVLTMTLKETFRSRVEVITPFNSWKRAQEAVHLYNLGSNPYAGNIFHEYPISLFFYNIITQYFNENFTIAIVDSLTAVLLYHSTHAQFILNGLGEAEKSARNVFFTYIFSPLALASCAGLSTTTFTNFLIASIWFTTSTGKSKYLTCALCGALACNNIYYTTLVVPIILCQEFCRSKKMGKETEKMDNQVTTYYNHQDFWDHIFKSIVIWLVSILTLLMASYLLMNSSWGFLKFSYLFALEIHDLTPNIGMFWYLFTEVFENFSSFFVWIVQINAFIHAIPLSVNLRDDPFFALYAVYLTTTVFQPYPSISNIGLLLSLTFQWSSLFQHMKRGLVVCSACIVCISLWPVFWHLWITMGTANANFYFGASLAFVASLILFMIDILSAHGYVGPTTKMKKVMESPIS